MLAPGKTRQARMWVYLGDEANPYNIFDFTQSRSRDGPAEFLKSNSRPPANRRQSRSPAASAIAAACRSITTSANATAPGPAARFRRPDRDRFVPTGDGPSRALHQ
jgi:hypothetical protein